MMITTVLFNILLLLFGTRRVSGFLPELQITLRLSYRRKEMGFMESRAKLFGHSVHQMVIVLPLGLLLAAFVFDIIYFIR